MNVEVPNTMQAIEIGAHNLDLDSAINSLKVIEKRIPDTSWNDVLIRLEAAPCNPSDLLFLQGLYGVKKSLPTVAGWEGCGTVVKAGSPLGRPLLGKRVAFAVQSDRDGTWAEYASVPLQNCVPIGSELSTEQAATFLVNPVSAYGMLDLLNSEGHKTIVQTAAASQLGKLVTHFAKDFKMQIIHVVRRDEQAQLIKDIDPEAVVLNSSFEQFDKRLAAECRRFEATAAIDAVAGSSTAALAKAIRPGGKILVYGALSGEAASIDPGDLIFRDITVAGFYLGNYLKLGRIPKTIYNTWKIKKKMTETKIEPSVQKRVDFASFKDALREYTRQMTAGKVLLTPPH